MPIVVGSFATSSARPGGPTSAGVDSWSAQYVDAYPDTLYVVAAGNEGANVDDPGNAVYPCSNDAPNIICVGMTDGDDKPVVLVQRRRDVGGPLRARAQDRTSTGVRDHARTAPWPPQRHVDGGAARRRRGRAAQGQSNTLSADA